MRSLKAPHPLVNESRLSTRTSFGSSAPRTARSAGTAALSVASLKVHQGISCGPSEPTLQCCKADDSLHCSLLASPAHFCPSFFYGAPLRHLLCWPHVERATASIACLPTHSINKVGQCFPPPGGGPTSALLSSASHSTRRFKQLPIDEGFHLHRILHCV